MKVFEFLDIFNILTEEQKQLELIINFKTPNFESCSDDECEYELVKFKFDRILDYYGAVVIKGED